MYKPKITFLIKKKSTISSTCITTCTYTMLPARVLFTQHVQGKNINKKRHWDTFTASMLIKRLSISYTPLNLRFIYTVKLQTKGSWIWKQNNLSALINTDPLLCRAMSTFLYLVYIKMQFTTCMLKWPWKQ